MIVVEVLKSEMFKIMTCVCSQVLKCVIFWFTTCTPTVELTNSPLFPTAALNQSSRDHHLAKSGFRVFSLLFFSQFLGFDW